MDGVKKFINREHFSLLWQMKISQKLPLEFETKLTEFQHFVTGLHQKNTHSLCQISNADETAVFLACLAIILQISKGETSGIENHRQRKLCITAMLCLTANDNTLPPYIISNRMTIEIDHFCKDVTVHVQRYAWMTSELMDVYGNTGLVSYQSHGVCLQ
jgi:hypothetical protein